MSRTVKTNASKVVASVPTKQPVSWKERLLPEEYEQLRNVFELFDQDHSGTIDPLEINKIMDELGQSRKGTFTHGLIEGLKGKNKPINFDEFLEIVCPKVGEVKTKEGLRTIFSHIDQQNDGTLDFEQLKHLAKISGDSINDDEILEMLHSIHIERQTATNESITFEEFYQIVSKFYKK